MTKAEKNLLKSLRADISRLSRKIDEMSVPRQRKKSQPLWQIRRNIHDFRALGLSDRAMAEFLGCSHQTVNKWRHRFGYHDSLASKRWS